MKLTRFEKWLKSSQRGTDFRNSQSNGIHTIDKIGFDTLHSSGGCRMHAIET
jgi:hypothetical protein